MAMTFAKEDIAMRIPTALAAISLFALSGCETLGEIPTEQVGSASLTLANGIPAGTARLVANGDTLSVAVAVTGLTPGEHGFHLHETGRCDRPDFASAGSHLNPYGKGHGLEDADGSHMGDLPNLTVSSSRSATKTVRLRGTRAELTDALFDTDGTAIVIHADPDDGTSEPSGNAGSRVACGVLRRD